MTEKRRPVHTPSPRSGPPAPPRKKASELVRASVMPLVTKGRQALARVVDPEDGEAVHDARVHLRRLRSIFRAAADLYAKAHVKAVRAALADAALRMGALRDEEALEELLRSLPLDKGSKAALDRWLASRMSRRRAARRAVGVWAATPGAGHALDMAAALVVLPVERKRDADAEEFAAKAVTRAERDVARNPFVRDDDARLHERRIAWKRLRYVLRAFADALPPVVVALEDQAKRQQELLGTAHDTHVARAVLARARSLAPLERTRIGEALDRVRADALARAEADLQPQPPTPAPPAKPSKPKRGTTPKTSRRRP